MRTTQRFAAGLGLAMAAVLGLSQFATSGTIDAVSGSSIQIKAGKTDTNSATINWNVTDGNARGSGTLTLYYNTSSATSGAKTAIIPPSSRSGERTAATYRLTGLTPATKYWFWMKITSGNYQPAASGTDTMRTDPLHSTSILQKSWIPSRTSASNIDPLGRRGRSRSPIQIDPNGAGIRIEPTAP